MSDSLSTITSRLRKSHAEMLEAELQGQVEKTKTAADVFNGTLSMAIDHVKRIVQTGTTSENIDSVANLTLTMLQVAQQINVANAAAFLCNICGAVVERLQDERLRSQPHCQAVFAIVLKFLNHRQSCTQQQEEIRNVDAVLENMCPPLMTFFANNLEFFQELRAKEAVVIDNNRLPQKSMIRLFWKQFIHETVLCVLVDQDKIITLAQRVSFTGLVRNHELRYWAVWSGDMPTTVQEIGNNLEMECWTALYFQNSNNNDDDTTITREAAHCIRQQGIPDDIAALDGERIILFRAGKQSRAIVADTTRIFPLIQMTATLEGPALDENERESLQTRIQTATKEEVIKALQHQQKRGGRDDLLQSCIDQLEKDDK